MPSTPGVGMHVEVKNQDDKVILSRVRTTGNHKYCYYEAHCPLTSGIILQVYSYEGRVSFISDTPGEHEICLYSNSTKWIGGTQLVLFIILTE